MGVMECLDQRKRILSFATAARNGLRRKWALYTAESQECEFLDEEPADDRRPQRDAEENKSKAKATYTQCLHQHPRVLHMRVTVAHVRVFVRAFWA